MEALIVLIPVLTLVFSFLAVNLFASSSCGSGLGLNMGIAMIFAPPLIVQAALLYSDFAIPFIEEPKSADTACSSLQAGRGDVTMRQVEYALEVEKARLLLEKNGLEVKVRHIEEAKVLLESEGYVVQDKNSE